MRAIDVHAHLSPKIMWDTLDSGRDWYGVHLEPDDNGQKWLVTGEHRTGPITPKSRFISDQRIRDMDSMGVKMQVVSVAPVLYNYHLDPVLGVQASMEVNDEISMMVRDHPDRFAGLATLPMQDVESAVVELNRAVTQLGLKGAEIDTSVNNHNWDEPQYLPLFDAAQELGALLFFHPSNSPVWQRTTRYYLGNTIGFTLEDTLAVAILIFGGVLERYPDLKVCVAHGGGPACFGAGRMDRGWQVRPEARIHIQKPPSTYLRRLFYDCVVHSEAALRLMISTVGADRVVLGSDWPFDMGLDSPVEWINGLDFLTSAEKDLILWENLEGLLGI